MDEIILELFSEVRRIYGEEHTRTYTFCAASLVHSVFLDETISSSSAVVFCIRRLTCNVAGSPRLSVVCKVLYLLIRVQSSPAFDIILPHSPGSSLRQFGVQFTFKYIK